MVEELGNCNGINSELLFTVTLLSLTLFIYIYISYDRLCDLVVRVLGYRSGGRVRFPALLEKEK
jgi:hypothetical protein